MKNLKSNLMYFLNLVIGVLTYVFLSQSYLALSLNAAGWTDNASATNGYDIIGNFFEGNGTEVMMALSNLIVAILAGVLILTTLYSMLVSFGVVKKSKAFKLVNFITIILSIVLTVFAAISLFCTVGYVSDKSVDIGIASGALEVGWAVIVNFVLAVVSIVASILASKFSKK